MDPTTLTFSMFFIGALIGVVVPALAQWDPSPNMQRGVQLFLAFMAIIAAAVSGGLAAPAAFVGLLAGYTFAVQAKFNLEMRMLLREVEAKE